MFARVLVKDADEGHRVIEGRERERFQCNISYDNVPSEYEMRSYMKCTYQMCIEIPKYH